MNFKSINLKKNIFIITIVSMIIFLGIFLKKDNSFKSLIDCTNKGTKKLSLQCCYDNDASDIDKIKVSLCYNFIKLNKETSKSYIEGISKDSSYYKGINYCLNKYRSKDNYPEIELYKKQKIQKVPNGIHISSKYPYLEKYFWDNVFLDLKEKYPKAECFFDNRLAKKGLLCGDKICYHNKCLSDEEYCELDQHKNNRFRFGSLGGSPLYYSCSEFVRNTKELGDINALAYPKTCFF